MNPLPYAALEIGARFASHGRTITETDLSLSCMLSGDWHPVHADEEFAKTTPVGKRMLHGPFGILLTMGVATQLPVFADQVIAATGLREWSYGRPIVVGDTLHVEAEIIAKRITSDGKRAIIERRMRLINQDGKLIQEGIAGSMVRLSAAGAGA